MKVTVMMMMMVGAEREGGKKSIGEGWRRKGKQRRGQRENLRNMDKGEVGE